MKKYNPKEVFPELPEISDEMRLKLHKKYAQRYLFYKKHRTYVDCYCTHCLTRFQLYRTAELNTPVDIERHDIAETIAHDVGTICPHCHSPVTARSEGIPRQKLTERYPRIIFLTTNDAVYAVCCEVVCGYGWDKMTIEEMDRDYGGSKLDVWSVIEYKPGSVRATYYNWYFGWNDTQNVVEPYIRESIYAGNTCFKAENPEVLWSTFLRYHMPRKYKAQADATAHEYTGWKPLEYLAYAVKYPAVEMLIKFGGDAIITDIIDRGRSHKSVINLEGKTPAEVFRTDGNEAAAIRQAMQSGRVDIDTLQCWRRLKANAKREKRKYKFEDAVALCGLSRNYTETMRLVNSVGLTPKKFLNYIDRQAEQRKDCPIGVMRIYKDYIAECDTLGYDVRDTQICKPSDLYAAHERTTQALQAVREEQLRQKDAELMKKYEKIYEKIVKKYEYSDKNYAIIAPKNSLEIVDEGKNLGHCVGGYAPRHMSGALTILFMRDVKNPYSALYTIEMQGDRLVQIRERKNCDPTPNAKKFVDKWLKYVKLPASKKHPKKKKNVA